MSKWRVELDISFNTEADAIAFINKIEDIKASTFTGTGNEQVEIKQRTRYHECFHDEDPPKQCGNYVNVDFKGSPIIHEVKSG